VASVAEGSSDRHHDGDEPRISANKWSKVEEMPEILEPFAVQTDMLLTDA